MSENVSFNRIDHDAKERWAIIRAVIEGSQAVKRLGVLPYLDRADMSLENKLRNESYQRRALFFGATARTLDGLLGIAFKSHPQMALTAPVAGLATDVDGAGVSLSQQSQEVLASVISVGRHGLLADFDSETGLPVIKSYSAESIINWRTCGGKLEMIVLYELVEEEDENGYGFRFVDKYRELAIENGVCITRLWQRQNETSDPELVGLVNSDGDEVGELVLRTKVKPLDFIPFTFVGSRNNDCKIDSSPMFSLAELNIGHFLNSADYEDSVFFSGQSQPFITGLTEEWIGELERAKKMRVGPRSPIILPVGGIVGYVQPGSNTMVKEAIDQKEAQMIALGARLQDQSIRVTTATQSDNDKEVSTSVLSACVNNVNNAYQLAIGWCAFMIDKPMTQDEIRASFKINPDYSNAKVDSNAVTALTAAWQAGAIALPDLRSYLRSVGVLSVERTDELIDGDLELAGPGMGSINGG